MVPFNKPDSAQPDPAEDSPTMRVVSALGRLRRVGQLSRKELTDLGIGRELVSGIARRMVEVGLALEKKAGREKVLVWAPDQADGPTVTMAQIAANLVAYHGMGSLPADSVLSDNLHEQLRRLIAAHARQTGDVAMAQPDLARRVIHLAGERRTAPDADVLDCTLQALMRTTSLRLNYVRFSGTKVEEVVEPYTLVFGDAALHLLGRVTESDDDARVDRLRLFNLGRVERARDTKEPFIYPRAQKYDPREYFRHVLYVHRPDDGTPEDIYLRFAPRLRHFLTRHPLHASQQILDTDDRGWFTVRLHLYWTDEVSRMVRGFGGEVEEVR